MKKQLPIFIAIIIIVAAGSFFGGLKYGQSKRPNNFFGPNGFRQVVGDGNQNRIGMNNRNVVNFVNGEIISQDEKSLTVKANDGGSKIIFLSDTTQVMKFTTSTAADLKTGDNIMVNGSANADGSLNAESIQVRGGVFMPMVQTQPAK